MAMTKQANNMVMVEMVTMMTVSFRPIDMSCEEGIYFVPRDSAALDTLPAHGQRYLPSNNRRDTSAVHGMLLIKGTHSAV